MGYIPNALRQLARDWERAIPSAVFSGIAPATWNAYGFHNSPNNLLRAGRGGDYSLQGWGNRLSDGVDREAYDALDVSMSRADMILVTGRIYRSWKDQNDPRLNGWHEIIGTRDGRNVIYMNCQTGAQGTADSSHLWHIHSGGLRINANNTANAIALLSVVKGETVAQWRAGQQPEDDMALDELLPPIAGETLATGEYVPRSGAPVESVQAGVALMYTLRHSYAARTTAEALLALLKAVAEKVDLDPAELEAIEAAARQGAHEGAVASADAVVTAILAALPHDDRPLSKADVADAVRSVFGVLAGPQG